VNPPTVKLVTVPVSAPAEEFVSAPLMYVRDETRATWYHVPMVCGMIAVVTASAPAVKTFWAVAGTMSSLTQNATERSANETDGTVYASVVVLFRLTALPAARPES
jgi:hypothetical protein